MHTSSGNTVAWLNLPLVLAFLSGMWGSLWRSREWTWLSRTWGRAQWDQLQSTVTTDSRPSLPSLLQKVPITWDAITAANAVIMTKFTKNTAFGHLCTPTYHTGRSTILFSKQAELSLQIKQTSDTRRLHVQPILLKTVQSFREIQNILSHFSDGWSHFWIAFERKCKVP